MRTPVNTGNRRTLSLCPEWQTLIHRQPRFAETGYLRTVYLIVTIMCSPYSLCAVCVSLLPWHFAAINCLQSCPLWRPLLAPIIISLRWEANAKSLCFSLCIDETCVRYVFPCFSESPVNTDTRIRRTLCRVPLVSVLTGFHCNRLAQIPRNSASIDLFFFPKLIAGYSWLFP